jgi:hypothetical protein
MDGQGLCENRVTTSHHIGAGPPQSTRTGIKSLKRPAAPRVNNAFTLMAQHVAQR